MHFFYAYFFCIQITKEKNVEKSHCQNNNLFRVGNLCTIMHMKSIALEEQGLKRMIKLITFCHPYAFHPME